MLEDYEESISLTLRTRSSRKPLEMQEKLETPMAPAMPCKTCKKSKHGEIRNKTNDFKSLFPCTLEASESTRLRVEESVPTYHEDHIAGRGDNSLQHYNLEHKIYSYASSNEDTRSKSSNGETSEDPCVGHNKSQKQIRGDR